MAIPWAPFLGMERKNEKKMKTFIQSQFRAPQNANLFPRKDLCLSFLEKLAQTINQNEAKCLSSLRVHVLS